MFSAKASAVKSMMVVGKLLILLTSSLAHADVTDPQFFEYRSNGFVNRIADFSFGWFKRLNDDQRAEHQQAIVHALMYSDNGQPVRWYKDDASGEAVVVGTWPATAGYCRRLHIEAIAYNVQKSMAATACYSEVEKRWTWVN